MDSRKEDLLRRLPSVDSLLADATVQAFLKIHPRALVVDSVREYLDSLRQRILQGERSVPTGNGPWTEGIADFFEHRLQATLRRAVNGTGIVLHTGLGRAPFADAAQSALAAVAAGYATLQVDPETGKRGDRHTHVELLLCRITGAEAALVVNNNAAATLLVLNTLAEGKEAVVSRGELLEIGGSFRIPDVMKRSGARLVEVGTTNRTHLRDYETAVTPDTALLLKVHQSNYRIVGFVKQVPIGELAGLAHAKGVWAVDDLGSGALVDLSLWGLPKEPTVQDSVGAGADAVCFSGDKLIGGPQCGVVVGKKTVIDRMKKNPLMRALRCDKMTYAVLAATLRLFLDPKQLPSSHPVLRMLTEPPESVRKRCRSLRRRLDAVLGSAGSTEVLPGASEAGSGSLAAIDLPTWVVSVSVHGFSAEELARRFRLSVPAVFGRVHEGRFLIDCRTILPDEMMYIQSALQGIVSSGSTV